MRATLEADAQPPSLRAGIQRAIAAAEDEGHLAVQLELISVLDGPSFRGSGRSRAFLRFVVEESLAGRRDLLKERTIGVAVLGKNSDYDTGADSTVRVRANEVRRRLAAHYEAMSPKAGMRIQLPLGTYAPVFEPVVAAKAAPLRAVPQAPPMPLRQLAAPTILGLFLALIAIRGGVESNDEFSRFWNQSTAGRSEIVVAVDSDSSAALTPAMADAAMPLARLADTLHMPVHIAPASGAFSPRACVIRLSLREKPTWPTSFRLAGATVYRSSAGGPSLWLWAEDAESLRSAAQMLTSRSSFPEVR